jgi:hypothetical protein
MSERLLRCANRAVHRLQYKISKRFYYELLCHAQPALLYSSLQPLYSTPNIITDNNSFYLLWHYRCHEKNLVACFYRYKNMHASVNTRDICLSMDVAVYVRLSTEWKTIVFESKTVPTGFPCAEPTPTVNLTQRYHLLFRSRTTSFSTTSDFIRHLPLTSFFIRSIQMPFLR